MAKILDLPHRVCESTCYINGLEDILAWKGAKYTDYLLSVLGGMGEFSYLKFKFADPPNMVYFGTSPKYLLNDLEKIIGFKQEIVENRVFKNTFPKIKQYIDKGQPVVAGALDMYYLNYYPDIYRKQHIPIHYILVVGYDDKAQNVFVHDCTFPGVKNVPYCEFEKALDVSVPGMSKRNTFRTFILRDKLLSEFEITKKGLDLRVERMLNPPVSMFGIPAMRKLAGDVFDWKDDGSFEHLVVYATIPPHIPESFENSTGMRQWKSRVLKELGEKYCQSNWVSASVMFEKSGNLIIKLCRSALKRDRKSVSDLILEVAEIEEKAYTVLKS